MGALVLLVVFIGMPIAELYVIVQSSHAIGFLNTLAALIVISAVGAWLVKRQGLRVWQRFNEQVQRGVVPSKEIADGVMLLIAGALMLAPGFITDVLALSLMLPPVRAVVRAVAERRSRRRAQRGRIHVTYSGPMQHDRGPGGVIDVSSDERD
ncbi:MAG: hypothetical protein RL219_2127 [Actinomycetota bacterium]